MSIKLVVFDMAGTTVVDRNFVGEAFSKAMRQHGYDVPDHLINPIMGYEKPVAIRMLLNDLEGDPEKVTDAQVSAIHEDFVKNMKEFYLSYQPEPLPGVEEAFEVLRENGVRIALNTGFSKDIAEIIVDRLGWADKVDVVVASDEVEQGRPAPLMIRKIMSELGIEDPGDVAKVGDTEVDVNEGINASCRYVIGVTSGSFTREELEPHHPTHIVDSVSEVLDIVLENQEA